jgi:hypothetical protein
MLETVIVIVIVIDHHVRLHLLVILLMTPLPGHQKDLQHPLEKLVHPNHREL